MRPHQPDSRVGLLLFYHTGKPMDQPIPIPYEDGDEFIHTDDHPFCDELDCLCHEDQEALAQVQTWITDGLITAEDADRIYRGMTV